MKITFEQAMLPEPEVIIRGDLADPRVSELAAAVQKAVGVSRLFLYRDEREYPHDFSEIEWFETCDSKTIAHVGAERFEAKYKLYELAEMGHRHGFVQISKSVLVNVRAVESVAAEFSGNYTAFLR
ncbi:MAG: LytTR family transcriptional regulator, partial [Butyricicoccus sp.]|nr:LytTR family transcriptional regulator [Butyricicoccus sp.]